MGFNNYWILFFIIFTAVCIALFLHYIGERCLKQTTYFILHTISIVQIVCLFISTFIHKFIFYFILFIFSVDYYFIHHHSDVLKNLLLLFIYWFQYDYSSLLLLFFNLWLLFSGFIYNNLYSVYWGLVTLYILLDY